MIDLPNGDRHAVAVVPQSQGARPVAILLSKEGGKGRAGAASRIFAEQGFTAIAVSYSLTDPKQCLQDIEDIRHSLEKAGWADTTSSLVVCEDIGGEQFLDFLANRLSDWPTEIAYIGGLQVPGTSRANDAGRTQKRPLRGGVLLVSGQEDTSPTKPAGQELAAILTSQGAEVTLRALDYDLASSLDRTQVLRGVADYYVGSLVRDHSPIRTVPRDGLVLALLVVSAVLFSLGVVGKQSWRPSGAHFTVLRRVIVYTGIAIGLVSFYAVGFALPRSGASGVVTSWVLVPQRWARDYEWLLGNSNEDTTVGALLDNLKLAVLQRSQFYRALSDGDFRQYVLSPIIDGGTADGATWRRRLWQDFKPRVKREGDPLAASRIIVGHLRDRVGICPIASPSTIESAWTDGYANSKTFERLYIAALRACGIAARLAADDQTELLTSTGWQKAPRPLIEGRLGCHYGVKVRESDSSRKSTTCQKMPKGAS